MDVYLSEHCQEDVYLLHFVPEVVALCVVHILKVEVDLRSKDRTC